MLTAALLVGAAAQPSTAEPVPARSAEEAGPAVTPPRRDGGAWVAKLLRPTVPRSAPGAGRAGRRLTPTLAAGWYPQELLVLDRRLDARGRDWLSVRLSDRPNGARAWISADDVRLRRTAWWVEIATRARTVRVYHEGRLRKSVRAVVGARATPTPHGLFAITLVARQADPRAFYGPWALHLTAHSDVLEDFGGGPGRVAIHGRAGASLADPLGSARSHGCIRISNATVSWMARVLRPGTPVAITGR